MADDVYDVLVVGGGVAGCVAGYLLAKAGLETIVIERGNYAGSKNMTGGRLYAHSLEKVIPGFAAEAPVERRVVKERISFTTDTDNFTIEYNNGRGEEPGCASYTVLRGVFDQWLQAQAEEAGAQFVPGVRVDEVVVENGKVKGVRSDEDVLEAKVVILADGVNSILGEKLGMVKPVKPSMAAVGVKELIELPQGTIEDRFNLNEGEGAAWLFAGAPSAGRMGGGFLYTNKKSISLGLVYGLEGMEKSAKSVPQMLEDFKENPAIKPLIKNGKMIEYSAHVVPEAGINMCPEITGDGVLIIGDAAGFCLNLGFTIRGMDLAVASAQAAAATVIQAKEKGDFSKQGLSGYKSRLGLDIFKDMKLYKKLPDFLEHNPRLYKPYPDMVNGIMHDMFRIDGKGERPLRKKILGHARQVGLINLASDALKGGRLL